MCQRAIEGGASLASCITHKVMSMLTQSNEATAARLRAVCCTKVFLFTDSTVGLSVQLCFSPVDVGVSFEGQHQAVVNMDEGKRQTASQYDNKP
jgi:hypothetical protein